MSTRVQIWGKIDRVAPLAQPQRTAPSSEFRGGRPCFDFWQFFGSFLSNQNVNVARFARNVE